jgi:hypothetical protein
VVVEWLNVTNNADMENTWFQIDEHLMRSGYAWVGVSAQRVGVNHLRTWSPGRYGTLDVSQRVVGFETITNDALAYDAFSQAAQAVRSPVGIDPLGGLEPQLVIATGHSQSAACLATYVNAIQPLSDAFDAFALHGSLGNPVRVDLEVPVWKVLAESDVNVFNEAQVRRPDDALFRTWEVAGTSHVDRRTYARRAPLERRDLGTAVGDSLSCGVMPPGSTVPFGYALAAGLEHLVARVRQGTPMPTAPPLETVSIFPTVVLARDGFGNVLGGLRLSQVEVPSAVNSGTNTGPGACNRWGYTLPFDPQTIATLYPSQGVWLSQVSDATDQNLLDGFILAPDAQQQIIDGDLDFVADPADNCPTTANGDQLNFDSDTNGDVCDACETVANAGTDTDMDGVDGACDTCTTVANAPLAGSPTANRSFVSHQRDDDTDGRGNVCDFDYNNLGATVTATDFNDMKASVGKLVSASSCGAVAPGGSGNTQRCGEFDHDGAGATVTAADFNATKANVGKVLGTKCAACTQGTGWSNVLGPGARVGRPVCQSAVAGACVYAP